MSKKGRLVGRPKNSSFGELGFDLAKINNKYVAICSVFSKHLQNTASSRLRGHRNICKIITRPDATANQEDTMNEDNQTIYVILDEDNNVNTHEVSDNNVEIYDANKIKEVTATECGNTSRVKTTSTQDLLSSPTSIWSVPSSTGTYSSVCSLSSAITTASSNSSFTKSPSTSPSLFKVPDKKNISNFIDVLTPKDIEEINMLLGNFVFGCNLPLRIVESKHFKKFIYKLRPAYSKKVPDRRELSTTLLDNSFESCLSNARRSLEPESVLLIDGWKNSSTNSKIVVTLIHTSDGQQAFIDAWDLSGISETAEKLVDIVIESIDKAKTLYNTTIYAIVSDNASVMMKMGKLSSHFAWHTTCNSHIGNLLAKDISNKSLTDKVSLVLKEFKHTDLECALIEKGGHRIKLPCETRWCSYRDSYVSLVDNLEQMKLVAVDKKYKKVKQNVIQLIFDDEFVNEIKDYIEFFNPICTIINECQKKSTSIADAVNLWKSLKIPPKFENQFKTAVEARKNMSCNTFSLTAYYLHPYYDETKLNENEKGQIYEFLFKNLDGEGIEEWDAFRNKNGLFKTLYEKVVKSPLVFWSMASIKYRKLSKIALKLLKIPASTAQIERLFSSWGYIHGPLRNRLSFERSKKLLHVYYSLRLAEDDSEEE